MKDLISEFEFHALSVIREIMPFGSDTFLFMGGGGVIQNNLMSLGGQEENVWDKENSPGPPVTL